MQITGIDRESDRLVGDYRLNERLTEEGPTATWLAEQVSVGRVVVLDELLDLSNECRENFLADTRARAAVDHPFIASVYEAVDSDGHCFRASECLTGDTLQSMLVAKKTIEPARLARVIRRIAEANLHHETNARTTLALMPRHIHVDAGDVTRVANLAVSGERGDGESARDVVCLGSELVPLVADGRPGTTRLLTLLAWMRGKERPAPLQWHEIVELCDQIDRQMSTPIHAVPTNSHASQSKQGRRSVLLFGGFAVAAIVLIMLFAWIMRPAKSDQGRDARLAPVLIPAGEYPTHDGTVIQHEAFLIEARETTIGEYREFMETLEVLAEDGRQNAFDHPEQPDGKTSHEPDDWADLLAAARARGQWDGRPVTQNSPVIGVDWWDAMAYANWRRARLPTEEEWAAAVHYECEDPAAIPAGPWHARVPADDCPDHTPAGILSVAGSLSEWTRGTSINPANLLGRPQHVIVGGSYLQPNGNALTREWIADPELRRADLGFRLVRDIGEEE